MPAPSVVEARIRSPPIRRARRRDTLSPSPDPPARAAAGLPNSNSSKTRSQASGSMPDPVSSTPTSSTSGRHATSTRMWPRSVNFAALATRLSTIWRTRSSSISRRSGTSGSTRVRTSTPSLRGRPSIVATTSRTTWRTEAGCGSEATCPVASRASSSRLLTSRSRCVLLRTMTCAYSRRSFDGEPSWPSSRLKPRMAESGVRSSCATWLTKRVFRSVARSAARRSATSRWRSRRSRTSSCMPSAPVAPSAATSGVTSAVRWWSAASSATAIAAMAIQATGSASISRAGVVAPCRVDRERHRERDEEQQQIPAPRRRAQHPLLRQQHRREAREVDAGDPPARRLDRVVEHQRARADEDAAIADERGERRIGVGGQRGPGQAIEPDRRQPVERPRIPELGAALLVDGEAAIAEAQHAAAGGRRPVDAGAPSPHRPVAPPPPARWPAGSRCRRGGAAPRGGPRRRRRAAR